jgi:hypothetical protein
MVLPLAEDSTAAIRWGPLGYLAYGGVYALLELAIIPAIPLTMTAGVLFGALPGLAVVSASGTLAATLSFLIARYAARDKVCCCSLAAWQLHLDPACSGSGSDAAEQWSEYTLWHCRCVTTPALMHM